MLLVLGSVATLAMTVFGVATNESLSAPTRVGILAPAVASCCSSATVGRAPLGGPCPWTPTATWSAEVTRC